VRQGDQQARRDLGPAQDDVPVDRIRFRPDAARRGSIAAPPFFAIKPGPPPAETPREALARPAVAPGRGRARTHGWRQIMDEINHVVAHFLDGKLLKGTTEDFSANRPSFHLHEIGQSRSTEVQCKKLKALFFVQDLDGNPDRRDLKGFLEGPGDSNQGKKVAVRFKDREIIFGYTLSYSRERSGFFMTPADPGSNNLRIFVLTAATLEVKMGMHADALAQQLDKPKAA
jgi:hypothetical protein